jgi:16S rRNA (guanine527-N7)-methyltransferase
MKELVQHARSLLGLQLSPAQVNALEIYEQELLEWNKRFNLTAIRDAHQIRIKHFLDSLTCLSVMRNPCERMIDVGTGAGFPGLPVKIIYPGIQLTLVESVGKKADFCRHLVKTLQLEGVQVIQERVEALGQMPNHRQQYDWAVARAVAIMPVLVEYLLPLARVGGAMLAMKGESAPAETQQAEYAIRLLGGHLRKLTPITLPTVVEQRYLVAVDKVAATPDAYPRRVGVPAKHPLQLAAQGVISS